MSPGLKNGILVVVLILIVAGAAWFFAKGDEERDLPDTDASVTTWKCFKCGKDIKLTAKQLDEWSHNPDKVRFDPDKSAKQMVFKCPDCQTFDVVRSKFDKICKVYFCFVDPDGRMQEPPMCPEKKKLYGGG